MLRHLPAFLFIGFILDLVSIIWMGRVAGVSGTLLLLLMGVVVGLIVFRAAGISVAAALRAPMQDLSSTRGLAGSTLFRVAAAILFMVPGFVSDLIAVAILIPPIQKWIFSRMNVVTVSSRTDASSGCSRFESIIEGEAIEIEGEIPPPDRQADDT